jgi:hypothetical protein
MVTVPPVGIASICMGDDTIKDLRKQKRIAHYPGGLLIVELDLDYRLGQLRGICAGSLALTPWVPPVPPLHGLGAGTAAVHAPISTSDPPG